MHHNPQMFLVMDNVELPKHIEQTFRLYRLGNKWKTELEFEVAVEGDDIDLKSPGYVILYANNSWHKKEAAEVGSQILSLRRDSLIMWLPVEVEESQPTASFFYVPKP